MDETTYLKGKVTESTCLNTQSDFVELADLDFVLPGSVPQNFIMKGRV